MAIPGRAIRSYKFLIKGRSTGTFDGLCEPSGPSWSLQFHAEDSTYMGLGVLELAEAFI